MPKNRTRGQVGRSNGGGQSEIGRLAKNLRQALKGKSIDDLPHVTLMAMIAEAQGTTLNRALAQTGEAHDSTGPSGAVRDLAAQARTADLVDLLEDALSFEAEAFATDDEVNGGDLVEWFGKWRQRALRAVGDGRPDGATPQAGFRAPPHSSLRIHDGKRFEIVQRLPESEGNPETGERLWLILLEDGATARAYPEEIWERGGRPTKSQPATRRTVTATFEVAEPDGVAPLTADQIKGFLDGYALPRLGVPAGNANVLTETPTVVLDATGGIYETCASHIPVDVIVYDADESNGFDSPNIYDLPVGDGNAGVRAWATKLSAGVDPELVDAVQATVDAGPRGRDGERIEVGTWLRFQDEQTDAGKHGQRRTGPRPVAVVDGVRQAGGETLHMVTFVPSGVRGCWTTAELKACAAVLPEGSDQIPTKADVERFKAAVAMFEESKANPDERRVDVPDSVMARLFRGCAGHSATATLIAAFERDPHWVRRPFASVTYDEANAILEALGIADRF